MTPGRAATLLGVLAVCLLSLAGVAADRVARAEHSSFRDGTSAAAAALAAELVAGGEAEDAAALSATASRVGGAACVLDLTSGAARADVPGEPCDWLDRPTGRGSGLPAVDAELVSTVQVRGEVVGLRVPLTPVRAAVVEARTHLYAAAGLVLALTAALLVRSGSRRQDELVAAVTRQLGALVDGDLSARSGAPHAAPTHELARAADAVAERLQVTVEKQRTFLADAAHQLRNPLLAVQLRLENLEPQVTAAGLRSHGRLVEDVKRLGESLGQLVAVTRTQHEGAAHADEVDVLRVVDERLRAWIPVASTRHVTMRQRLPEAAVALARPGALEQTLDVLVDNALKHAPPGTEVSVVVVPGATSIEVVVEDRGPGLPPAAREQALQRGWQADHRSASGSGLGLAIASMLVSSSGGSLRLEDREGGGLRACVRLPTPVAAVDPALLPAWNRAASLD